MPLAKFTALTQMHYVQMPTDEFMQVYNRDWSMVYFLMHADGGKHQKALFDFIKDISAGKPAAAAMDARFGPGGTLLGKPYEKFWSELPKDPSPEVYAQATVAILTSFLSRATASGQKFKDVNDFIDQAEGEHLLNSTDQWLPAVMLKNAVGEAMANKDTWHWLLENGKKFPKLSMKSDDGMIYTGTFDYLAKRTKKKGDDGQMEETLELSRLHVDVTVAKAKKTGNTGLRQ